ncbi:MAG TPA: WG repeat-containing protein [Saprospiraceae bacterium]|nr:WG repeat-containing protein [Saprospiraceae bacterium]HPI07782.1 WG repeat-containing protein [Saprospiraceae bacterium]
MKSNKFVALIILSLFTALTAYGQASCEIKENYGNVFQFNNNGNVYITFCIFKVEADQLLIDVIKNLRADTITPANLPRIAENQGKVFVPVPAGSSEANAALEKARTVFIPAVKENVKESVCWEDVIDNAQKKGQITIQKADENTVRVIIGEASTLLQDFKIIFSGNADGIVRVRENGKYAFELTTGNCLINIGSNCKRYDFATDFKDGQALVGEKVYGGKTEYYYINKSGQRVSNNTYTEVTPNFAGIKTNLGGISRLKRKDGKVLLSENEKEYLLSNEYDNIEYIGTYDGNFFLSVKENKKAGIISHGNFGYWHKCYEVLPPTLLDDIDTMYSPPVQESVFQSTWISVKTGNYWNIIEASNYMKFDSTKFLLKGKYAHPIRVQQATQYGDYNLIKSGSRVGLITKYTATIVFEPIFDEIGLFDTKTGLAKVRIGEIWGLISNQGKIVLPVEFDEIGIFDETKHAKIKRNGLLGFADTNGKIVLNTMYDKISGFDKYGVAIIEIAGKKGCIDANKKVIFTPKYDEIGEFTDQGNSFVMVNNNYGLISRNRPEKELIEPTYQKITDLKNGNFFFKYILPKGSIQYGIIKPDKSITIIAEGDEPPKNSMEIDFNYDAKCILIRISFPFSLPKVVNFEGETLYEGLIENQPPLQEYSPFYYYDSYPDFTVLKIKNNSYKYLFLKDGKAIGPIYDYFDAKSYLEYKMIKVQTGTKIGCIDFSGKRIIPIQYKKIETFSPLGYTFVMDSVNNYALFSSDGKQMTGFDYNKHGSFSKNNVQVTCKSGGTGYLLLEKEAVQTLITCKYFDGSDFINDLAIVKESDDNMSTGIINTSDLIVAPFIFNSITRDDQSFVAVKDGKTYVLRKSDRANLKRLECVSGDCSLYEKLTKAFFETRN